MSDSSNASNTPSQPDLKSLEALYHEAEYWHVNTGDKTIHAKRMPGTFRRIKWMTMSVWLIFFLGPYLRWNGQQAVLFDIPARQFHIFNITILPQDVWMLALVMLFFALLLAAVTSIAGRVFCGYFCFQTVWTDIFVWIEEKLEGPPARRVKLDAEPWSLHKLRIKFVKHSLWLAIGLLTGISFTLWFGDAFELWKDYLTLQAPLFAWGTVGVFVFFTHLFAGHMREQVCFWLCPYARIQGVMYDRETILPTYDFGRGEPRGKLKKGSRTEGGEQGDCIDCKQCVAVCPTGIDIRTGQQEGCITCALCLDACDAVMDKVHRPHGLIRYASLDEVEGKPTLKLYQRPRVVVYFAIMLAALGGIFYGLTNLGALELKALHERQPLFVRLSDGSIQNKYVLKILNKTEADRQVTLSVHGHAAVQLVNAEKTLTARQGGVTAHTIFLRIAPGELTAERIPLSLRIEDTSNPEYAAEYNTMFFGPPPSPASTANGDSR
ncbi:MAG: cytochrome c oxidase accessory protein CcoG [Gammaproteobacteria bacterium]|nr:cytochrome c oxidase accessory protein CcoG [Gammaproteobacteria bacterium]